MEVAFANRPWLSEKCYNCFDDVLTINNHRHPFSAQGFPASHAWFRKGKIAMCHMCPCVGSAAKIIRTPQRLVGEKAQAKEMKAVPSRCRSEGQSVGPLDSSFLEPVVSTDGRRISWALQLENGFWLVVSDMLHLPGCRVLPVRNFCTVVKRGETCWNMSKPSTKLWFTKKLRL